MCNFSLQLHEASSFTELNHWFTYVFHAVKAIYSNLRNGTNYFTNCLTCSVQTCKSTVYQW